MYVLDARYETRYADKQFVQIYLKQNASLLVPIGIKTSSYLKVTSGAPYFSLENAQTETLNETTRVKHQSRKTEDANGHWVPPKG